MTLLHSLQIIEIDPEDPDQVTIKHMENKGELKDGNGQKRDDIRKYQFKEILKVIPPPSSKMKGVYLKFLHCTHSKEFCLISFEYSSTQVLTYQSIKKAQK
ncbi:hypothetical protein JTB14_011717 [Gonioctena quinquepunctata]|nr:hypothetical protein JTB14_011717 [Gonioctena quinquepunctata]